MANSKQDLTAIIRDKRGNVLAIGKNSYIKTHPFQAKLAKRNSRQEAIFLHAEIAAVVACKNIDKAYSIEVMRTMKDGSLGLAAPCEICMDAIKNFTPIKRILYSE